ncbi:hypothetical protein L5G32_14660 [Gordonia sp. HY002]|uniref:hypothetical protein n=1 Tax=Gordonia zhenghanii TaxID=2911516 RepID=UPI001F2D1448|nr:hypothetical protein [Gordonia zhenghanii]MCF8571512.1 hypothetical protein [Gordonia zhenghanii]
MNVSRRAAAGIIAAGAAIGAGFVAAPGSAQAAPVTPFQINPALYGNPNGSFDVPAFHCGVEWSGPGEVTVTGTERDNWGCLLSTGVRWINLSTGRTGAGKTSPGLHGHPPEAVLHTGRGRVALILDARAPMTPGLATFDVR